MKAHNMNPRMVRYRFPCIILWVVPIPLDTIERGLTIDYHVVTDPVDATFGGGVAIIWLT